MHGHTIATVLACGLAACSSNANIYMTDENGGSIGSSHYSITNVGSNNYEVVIKSHHAGSQGTSYFEVHGTGGENITKLTIQVPSDGYPGNLVVVRVKSDEGTGGINDLDEVVQSAAGTEGAALNRVDVLGDIGSISVDAIGDIDAVGDITGPIEATGDHWSPTITTLECSGTGSAILGDVTSAGRIGWIQSYNGNIGSSPTNQISITCTYLDGFVKGKNVYADVTASSGRLDEIQATNGDIYGTISATSGEIERIKATGNIVAAVSAVEIDDYDAGTAKGIEAGGDLTLVADLSGSLRDPIKATGGDLDSSCYVELEDMSDQATIE